MKRQWILLAALLIVGAVTAGVALLPSSPGAEGPAYTNTTYKYAVTYPSGWQYGEVGGSVAFYSPSGHEEMRITADLLSGNLSGLPSEAVLGSLNATYLDNFTRDIPGTEWVSTTEAQLDGAPAYESTYSMPIQGEDRYTFVSRYAVRDGVIYSVMYTEFPPEYDPYTGHGRQIAESFRFL